MSEQGTSRARGVERVISILKQLHVTRRPMSMRELVETTGTPRSSVYELVALLTQAGWLEQASDGSVFFGREMHYYGADYASHNDLIKQAHQLILSLVRAHDETAQLCMLEGNKYTVVLSENSPRPFKISSDIGVKVPIPWTASGRLLLGHLTDQQILALIPDEDFVLDTGVRIEKAAFLRDVGRAREQGFFCTEGLSSSVTCCMAAPVRDRSGRAFAALCFMTGRDTPAHKCEEMLGALVQSARQLSQSI
jgi:DNA-binding IclR family transcriptional regulator